MGSQTGTVPPDYWARIRELRKRLGLTQARLAELLGVSFASVNRWENAQARPTPLAWQQVARAEELGIAGLRGGPDQTSTIAAAAEADGQRPAGVPDMDFTADPELVRLVVEAERLGYGHLFNPAFGTEVSLIEPLPHQRMAVYQHMLQQPRLRFLLADDAGAGKTIMTGLYVREMLARRLIRRALIVPPAGLVGNWERELRTLFGLSFRIVSGGEARLGNPFVGPESDLVIVSLDTLAGERMFRRLQEAGTTPYDLVVFDEAHKLSAEQEPDLTIRKTDRYRLAEALAGIATDSPRWALGWSCQHLLLLTATPHMGRDFPYFCLWRLLEPETLSSIDAFNAYPAEARQRHFIRRTKEELVRLDGTPIYPTRVSDTLSYELTRGEISEQRLYDEATRYLRYYYNRARILNRSAARLAMSVFQRRLASSTYALKRSLERRLARLEGLIDDIRSGKLKPEDLLALQRRLDAVADVLDVMTGDEETPEDGREQNEAAAERALGGVVAVNLAELEAERQEVAELLGLAEEVYQAGHESKLEKLREVLRDPRWRDEKLIVFTEHRDTLEFLVRRLEGMGFTGQVAQIHGGMDYREREEQVEFFRRPASEGGATYLVATDAAGEGINLQFCWLMVNYDVPWNPARLEQRMGRIHRYGQQHDPVVILNLVAGKTREGRVLKTLLDKLEQIRKAMGSDKVFDVVGRLFEGVSLKEYIERALSDDQEVEQAERQIEGRLTKEQVEALRERERRLYGDGGDVQRQLPQLKESMEGEELRRLLPGYVRRFIEQSAPRLEIAIEGDLDGTFAVKALRPGALDPLWPGLESYPAEARSRLTVYRAAAGEPVVFLRPGEPVFERWRGHVAARFAPEALKGGVFVDAYAERPYLFHLALATVIRRPEPSLTPLASEEALEYRLVGLKQEESGRVTPCPVEHLLLLKRGDGVRGAATGLARAAEGWREVARAFAVEHVARPLAEERRQGLKASLEHRQEFLARGYDYQAAELATARARLLEKAQAGDRRAQAELARVKERQRGLAARRQEALAALRQEPELIQPGEVSFLAHALVVPTEDPEDRRRHDEEVEAAAVRVARAYEQANGATVLDVSTPQLALAAGLPERPGFDLLSRRPGGEERDIEVKGRAGVGDVELTENEWAKACNLRERYWLYVVYECATPRPQLLRVQDPFWKLLVRERGRVLIDEREILVTAEEN